ncbi:hypothetical protein OK074_9028 [Actinobacteria bacterium OK074]|nr:hypothetical protein OK074_9028 [Actinobacteria bacterium OK074]
MKALRPSRPVLRFLFLFNLLAALVTGLALDGAQGVATSVGMAVVSLGAAIALFRDREQEREREYQQRA